INTGDTVQAGYQLLIPGTDHPAATASLVHGDIQADIRCFDGSSYTLTLPLGANQSYTIPAGSGQWVPGKGTWQGSATATGCADGDARGVLEGAYFSALNVSTGVGNPPTGTGLTTTDPSDPLVTRFAVSANGKETRPSKPVTVDFQQ
ncbi:MAG: hypothetical protein ACRETZ_10745, partial [Steroidobacteraceae bacterium]